MCKCSRKDKAEGHKIYCSKSDYKKECFNCGNEVPFIEIASISVTGQCVCRECFKKTKENYEVPNNRIS